MNFKAIQLYYNIIQREELELSKTFVLDANVMLTKSERSSLASLAAELL